MSDKPKKIRMTPAQKEIQRLRGMLDEANKNCLYWTNEHTKREIEKKTLQKQNEDLDSLMYFVRNQLNVMYNEHRQMVEVERKYESVTTSPANNYSDQEWLGRYRAKAELLYDILIRPLQEKNGGPMQAGVDRSYLGRR